MQLTLTKFRTQAGKYGTELLLTHIKLCDDKGKYIKFLSVEEALPYLQDHTFTIGDIEKYIDKNRDMTIRKTIEGDFNLLDYEYKFELSEKQIKRI